MRMHRADSAAKIIPVPTWRLGLCGTVVDTRGKAAEAYLKQQCSRVLNLSFDPDVGNIRLDGTVVEPDQLNKVIPDAGGVVLETTTLGFVEVAVCCDALRKAGARSISLLYVEPGEYFIPDPGQILLTRQFALTEEVTPYSGVPGWIKRLDETKSRVVFFLGFEGERLLQAIEQLPLDPRRCSVVFGVPAFRPGWELNAFANNVSVLREARLAGGIDFCAADNPWAAIDHLNRFYEAHSMDDVFVVPIGTKPHGIGAAIFAATKSNIGIFYDHPKRKIGRSDKLGTWHLFDVDFESK